MKTVIYEGDGRGFYAKQVFPEVIKNMGGSRVTYRDDWNALESTYVWEVKDLGITLKYHRKVEPSETFKQKVIIKAFGGRKRISDLESKIKKEEAKWNSELADDLAESAIAGMAGFRSQIGAVLKQA